MSQETQPRYLFKTEINSFHYLYQDADYLMSAAKLPNIKGTFAVTRITRSAMILYILSLEALINRALDHFVPQPIHDFLMNREDKLSTIDKWRLLPLLVSNPSIDLDLGRYPWSHMSELIKIRNDYAHPKHDRKAYYEFISKGQFRHMDWKSIPTDCCLSENDLIYRQTKLPKDPYGFDIVHLETVKKIVDDAVSELDKILDGKILKDNWARKDQMQLFHPPGATIDDIGRQP